MLYLPGKSQWHPCTIGRFFRCVHTYIHTYIHFFSVARKFQRGGGSHSVTPRVLARLACRCPGLVLLKMAFFRMSSERGEKEKPKKWLHRWITWGRGVLWISSDRDDQMGAKIKIQKILLGFKQNERKTHAEFPGLKNLKNALNDIKTPKKPYLNQAIPKSPEIENLKPKRILRSPLSLEYPPPPPAPGMN